MTHSFSVPWPALRQTFQLDNDAYFAKDTPSLNTPEIEDLAAIFQKLEMGAGEYFGERSPVRNVTTYTHANDNDQLITFVDYELPNNGDGENTHHLAAVFVKTIINDQDNTLSYLIYAAFEGQVIGDSFIPANMLYREDDSTMTAIDMNTPNKIQAAWWYIDSVFVRMLAESDTDVAELVKGFRPEESMFAEDHFGYMFSRNEGQLASDIADIQIQQQENQPKYLQIGGRFFREQGAHNPCIEFRFN